MRSLFVFTSLAAFGAAAALFACGSDTDAARDTSTTLPDAGGPDAMNGSVDAASEPDSGDAAPNVPGVPVEDVCQRMGQQICAFLTGCSQELVDGLWADPKDCVTRFEDNCSGGLPANAMFRKDDADAQEACIEGMTCDALYGPRWTTACPVPRLTTAKPIEAPCRIDSECESGSCTGDSSTCGKCVARLPAGSPCTDRAQCAYGGYCDDVCIEMAGLGQSCDATHACGNSLTCASGTCVKAGGAGAACNTSLDCDGPAQLGCNRTTKKCEPITFAEAGEACSASSGPPTRCMKGSRCESLSADGPATCVAPAKVGEACSSDQPCESFINCRDGKCVLPTYVPCP